MEDTQESLLEQGNILPLVVLPYTAGISKDIRRVCRKSGVKVAFRIGQSLHSVLTRVKDPQVVYWIPCSCGKAYIGKTRRRLETRLKEHQDACQKETVEKSAVAEHAWENHHPIKWDETTVVNHARRPKDLLLKERKESTTR